DVGWRILAEAALSVRAGATWVATNTDRTLPSPRGPLPGNGSLVAVLRTALDREPDLIVGKPEPALFTTAASLSHAERPLAVGDPGRVRRPGGRPSAALRGDLGRRTRLGSACRIAGSAGRVRKLGSSGGLNKWP